MNFDFDISRVDCRYETKNKKANNSLFFKKVLPVLYNCEVRNRTTSVQRKKIQNDQGSIAITLQI